MDPAKLTVTVAIPTFNRADLLRGAIDAALGQDHPHVRVLVVDDGSTDGTPAIRHAYRDESRVGWVTLHDNHGTATAKNAAIAYCSTHAITFHDSDDLPTPDKVGAQAFHLAQSFELDGGLNWTRLGRRPGERATVDAVFCGHRLHTSDGQVEICNPQSLLDDLFPNVQPRPRCAGDWMLVNTGLFRMTLFEELGGYSDSIEEDRDLRNRIVADGRIVRWVQRPLLDKYERDDSLTVDPATNYASARRHQDRARAWGALDRQLRGHRPRVPIALPSHSVHGPAWLEPNPRVPTAPTVRARVPTSAVA